MHERLSSYLRIRKLKIIIKQSLSFYYKFHIEVLWIVITYKYYYKQITLIIIFSRNSYKRLTMMAVLTKRKWGYDDSNTVWLQCCHNALLHWSIYIIMILIHINIVILMNIQQLINFQRFKIYRSFSKRLLDLLNYVEYVIN